MAGEFKFDVFLSHSTKDKAIVRPIAERLSNEVFSLPVHPQLTQEDLEIIVREVNAIP
mgnify:CR=1 FL=1